MKKIISVLLSLVMIIGAFAGMNVTVSATYADERWQWTDDGVQQERCTYRVWHEAYERLGISLPTTWGNAGSWASKAAEQGYLVDHNPIANSIICWGGTGWGHVAYVTAVDSSYVYYRQGGINPSNSNTGYWYNDTKKTISEIEKDTSFKGYIHLRCTTHTWDGGKVTTKPTCKKNGIKTYTCTVCGETKTEKTAKSFHNYKALSVTKKATLTKNGTLKTKCSVCGKKSTSVIYRPKTFKLSKSSFTYNGKVQKPAVTLKDVKGKAVSKNYYTLSYKNNKKVGKATVSVKFKGRYSGTKTLNFMIVPKGTSIKKLTTATKAFTVQWNKQSTQTTGYQIQYATNKNFKSAKSVTVGKTATVSKKITGLTAGKTYYVRVRTYKKIGNTKYYSGWSASNSVIIKTNYEKYLPYYADVINQYQVLIKKGCDDSEYANNIDKYCYVNSQWVAEQNYSFYREIGIDINGTINYSLYDLNKDGFPELFISDAYHGLLGIFAYTQSKICEIADSLYWGYRCQGAAFENGTITSSTSYYVYKNNEKIPTCAYSIGYDYGYEYIEYNIENPMYYGYDNGDWNNKKEITKAEAVALDKKYTGNNKRVKFTWKNITSIPSSKLGAYNGLIRKLMEGTKIIIPNEGCSYSAKYYYLDMKTPYSTKKALVLEAVAGSSSPYTIVYIKNNKGKIVKYFECAGGINKYSSDKNNLLLYGYPGSGYGVFYFLKYNSTKKHIYNQRYIRTDWITITL